MTSIIKKQAYPFGRGLQKANLNDLPNEFASYGFWGGHGCTNVPFDGGGFIVITIPATGGSSQAQVGLSANKIALRLKSWQGVWSNWMNVSLS